MTGALASLALRLALSPVKVLRKVLPSDRRASMDSWSKPLELSLTILATWASRETTRGPFLAGDS
eukprot:13856148-Alexandrium_andersonii.AAC.1